MKVLPVLSGLATLLAALPASAGVTLDGGYKVEGEFNEFVPTSRQLLTYEYEPFPEIIITERPDLSINVRFSNTFTPADTVRLEFFTTDQEPPLFSCEFTGQNDTTVPWTTLGIMWFNDTCPDALWPELRGAYRFTMLSGTSDLEFFNIRTFVNRREYILNVDSFPPPIPVPEPTSLALFIPGLGSLLLRRSNRKGAVSNSLISVRPLCLCASVAKVRS